MTRTSSSVNIREYQQYIYFPSVETCVYSSTLTFLHKYCAVNNLKCIIFTSNAMRQVQVTQARVIDCKTFDLLFLSC